MVKLACKSFSGCEKLRVLQTTTDFFAQSIQYRYQRSFHNTTKKSFAVMPKKREE